MQNGQRRVVVTGLGTVSPVGNDVYTTWESLINGKSGIGSITAFDTTGFETTIAGEVKGFDPLDYIERKEARRMDRFVQFAVAASKQAIKHAGLEITHKNSERAGVLIGSGMGGLITLSEQFNVLATKGPDRVSPFLVPMMIADMAAGQVSIALGAKGPNWCPVSACASGAHAIGEAFDIIRRGDADVMITGGSEATITPIGIAGFQACRALSTYNHDPEHASRPFDKDRDGFVMGEGAGILVLESLDSALERGARPIAELVGYGQTGDAYHITQPAEKGEGGRRAMSLALKMAGLAPEDIDYINAHGTGTPINDVLETCAIKNLFGEHAYKVQISSTKSMTGHLLGAAGAVEAVVCALTLMHQLIHPTTNLNEPDPQCDLDYVPNTARKARVRAALTNSFGFGGHNASLILKEWTE